MNVRTPRPMIVALLCVTAIIPDLSSAQTIQPYPQADGRLPGPTGDLNASLARLGEDPRDVGALISAGEAALALNDARAATGFFARADEIQSGNGRIKAGLGHAMLELQNPAEALRLFDQAERLGQPATGFLSDRGLARDLTGDQAGAQRDYVAALRAAPNDGELIRRYAVSLGISGQVDAADKVIQPLLYKNDRAAWRNRAFVFAMNGRKDQARDITQKVMPKPLADAIQPYMDRMVGLTPAQRAAAVHFGNFPASTGVRVAANSVSAPRQMVQPIKPAQSVALPTPAPTPAPTPVPTPVPSATAIPSPRAVIGIRGRPDRQASAPALSSADAMPRAVPRVSPAPVRQAEPVMAKPSPTPQATVQGTPNPVPGAPRAKAAPSKSVVQGPVDPGPAQIAMASSAPSSPVPEPVATPSAPTSSPPTPNPVATRTLADIIRELEVPEAETQQSVAAVDLAEIAALQEKKRLADRAAAEKVKRDAALKAKAEADLKAKALAAEKARLAQNPSRNWVQIATGQSVSALSFTLRGLRKQHSGLAAKDAWTAPWNRTNRLVVGPFPTFDKAQDFASDLKKAGADVFAWQSDAGEDVIRISGK